MTPAQVAHIMALAKECGAITYTHRSNPHEAAVSFGPIAWAKFVEAALIEAPQAEAVGAWKNHDTAKLVNELRDELASRVRGLEGALILMIRTHDEPAETLLQEAKEQQWLAQARAALTQQEKTNG